MFGAIGQYFKSGRYNHPTIRIKNFGRVSGYVYRGALPDSRGYSNLAKADVSAVLNLADKIGVASESSRVLFAGIKNFAHVPMRDDATPNPAQIKEALHYLRSHEQAKQRVYFSCLGGRHRTSLIAASYRVIFDGWDKETAWREEAEEYGYYDKILFAKDHSPIRKWFFNDFNPQDDFWRIA